MQLIYFAFHLPLRGGRLARMSRKDLDHFGARVTTCVRTVQVERVLGPAHCVTFTLCQPAIRSDIFPCHFCARVRAQARSQLFSSCFAGYFGRVRLRGGASHSHTSDCPQTLPLHLYMCSSIVQIDQFST